ncbi:S-formylglutathione hydrolase FrmB [Nocardia transvalensis]|uniref:S-formylglutathione hydrolase FrmB n=1 Tax=Nocardia transvalensis TaxID=37333 RepID=A0A7W9ULA9_9NOCA|nr:alpha/beta hydrolase family protein [Nocardia transvalensis]MBB5916515.1 S-formylglutathione hydrolase FrmB [Nocardia transvalensis]
MNVRAGQRFHRHIPRATVLACAAALACATGPAVAEPAPDTPLAAGALAAARPAEDGSRLLAAAPGPGRVLNLTVHSAAMNRPMTVAVLPAADPAGPAPTLYLLNGVDGGTDTGDWRDGSNWLTKTDVADFFADKQVNVVIPIGGGGSFFTDWRADDPVHGRQRWTTFLTRELPPVVDSAFHGTGANVLAGLSMASTSVFQLALAAPGLFRGIGAYSGCVRTSDPMGQLMVDAIVTGRMGNTLNMWGPPSDPAWAANDPYLHAAELRGTAVYVASGNGAPGPLDTLDGPGIHANPAKLVDQLVIGGILDAIAGRCTVQLRDRLRELDIPATVDLRDNGTHSWGYWEQDLHNSWPVLAAALDR